MTSITYDTRTCSRCAGEKIFRHWSHIAGGRCFKCNGRGYFLTAAGRRASAAIMKFTTETFSVPVTDLKPGDRVYTLRGGLRRTVAAVTPLDETYHTEGGPGLTVRYTKPIENLHGIIIIDKDVWPAGSSPTLVRIPRMGADWDRVIAYARTLKLKGLTLVEKPDKEPVAA